MAYRIDAHQHFWRFDPADYRWIAPDSLLARDYLPVELAAERTPCGIAASVAVQARQTMDETEWLLSLAAADPSIIGVVGWVDLQSDDIEARLDGLCGHDRLVGIRHIVQDEPDEQFLLRPAFLRGVRETLRRGLAYDILIYAHQAGSVPEFVDRAGAGRFILDHGGKPRIAGGEWQPWAGHVRQIAANENVFCKTSGLVTEASHAGWTAGDVEPYLGHLLESFGPDRLIFGSDWPVCRLAADYSRVVDLCTDFVSRTCPGHHEAIFGTNAARAYRLECQ